MILVVGATGQLCGCIVGGLLQKGRRVRVLVTHASAKADFSSQGPATTIRSLIEAGAKPMWGDLANRASLRAALDSVHTVIAVNETAGVGAGSEIPGEPAGWNLTSNLIEEAQAAGVQRFLLVSLCGKLSPDRGIGRDDPRRDVYEHLLQVSGMTYTIVRPTFLMEMWIGLMVGIPLMTHQAVTLIGRGDHAHNFISEQDLASYLVAMVDHPNAFNQTVVVGGPASYTWTEIVSRMRRRVDADLPIQYAMMDTPIPYLPDGARRTASRLETFEDYLDIGETAKTYGVKPTTLDDYIDRTYVGLGARV